MAPVIIRPYVDTDFAAIARIHDASRMVELADTVGVEAFLSLADTYENEGLFDDPVLVAELDGTVVGFVAASADEVNWLYVHPDHFRQGVATRLLDAALADAGPTVEASVLAGTGTVGFYEAYGFRITGTTTGKLVGNEKFDATGHTMVLTRFRRQ